MKDINKKAIIFGAAGFIGSHLVEKLLDKGFEIHAFDIVPINKCNNLKEIFHLPKFKYTCGDIKNKESVNNFFPKDAEIVYHLASVVGVREYINDPLSVIETIIDGSRNIINLCVKHKTRILFASTSEIYGKNPNTPWKENGDRVLGDPSVDRWSYATSKAIVEHILFALYKQKKIDFSTVRFFNVYGPRQNPIYVVSQTIYRILRGEPPDIYDEGKSIRCFTYIDDVIEGLILAATRKEALGNVFNLGSQIPTNMKNIVDLCIKISGKEITVNEIETKKFYGQSYQDIFNRIPDSSKANKLLGWSAKIKPEEGIKRVYEWIKNNNWYIR